MGFNAVYSRYNVQSDIVTEGERAHTRCNEVNAEKTTFFYNFVRVSQGLFLLLYVITIYVVHGDYVQ